ncbi:MAG: hypothetical protein AB7F98_05445 [Novosphingobium sp.]
MVSIIERPVPQFDPAKGLLNNDHFQLGYVTSDIAAAERLFAEHFGVREFRRRDNDLPGGTSVSTRTVWIGAMMYELACGKGPGMEQFSRFAPADGRVMAFHHFGYLVPDDASWQSLAAEVARGGWEVLARSDAPGFARTMMIHAPELGHCLEYVQPREGLAEQMNRTPCA